MHGTIRLPHIVVPLTEKEKSILQDVAANGSTTISEESTVSRRCSHLADERQIALSPEGRSKVASILLSGEVMLRA